MTAREESPVTPLAGDQTQKWNGTDNADDQNDNNQVEEMEELQQRQPDQGDDIEDQDDDIEDLHFSNNAAFENWRSILSDPNKTVSQLVPCLEAFGNQNEQLRKKIAKLSEKLHESKSTHRGSIVALHTKMFRKLLDAEEKKKKRKDNPPQNKNKNKYTKKQKSETKLKKMSELERKIQMYEQIDRDGNINKSLEQFAEREQKYANE
ncbi:hypothetical protein RFI_19581, partial [Reticulomyxa filosa]